MIRVLLLGAALMAACMAQDATLMRVSETDAKKAIVSKTDPEYPAMARQMNLFGRVILDIFIDEEGKVEKVQPVSGNQLLTSAAVSAVKKWKFTPFAKKAVTSMAFDFRL
jgi:TonB family protein